MNRLAQTISENQRIKSIDNMIKEVDNELGDDIHVEKTIESIKFKDFAQA